MEHKVCTIIPNVVAWAALPLEDIIQYLRQPNMRFTSQLVALHGFCKIT